MKIAVLSNVTVEVLAGMLREGHSVWTPPGFGAWAEAALDPPADFIAFAPDLIAILLDARHAPRPDAALVESVRAALSEAFPSVPVIVPDLSALLSDLGDAAYDERMWALAKMPWSIDALAEIRKLLVPPKKVLALDLDDFVFLHKTEDQRQNDENLRNRAQDHTRHSDPSFRIFTYSITRCSACQCEKHHKLCFL